ncbi:putative quinol monooxygenase [Aquibaculum sediminis]|uniref:putative quinol monooxygenase n=1 Tax=Aquibaculum sediminis TaxID=3231907 RepID=UPI003456F4DE
MYVILVQFDIKEGYVESFRDLIVENAISSRTDEPGCLQFDVCEAPGGTFHLYEIYENEARFNEHKATPHFNKFNEATSSMVAAKNVVACHLISGGPIPGNEI